MTWAGELLSGQQQRADADCPLRALSSLAWEASTFTMECEGLEQEGVFRQPASPLLPPPHPHTSHTFILQAQGECSRQRSYRWILLREARDRGRREQGGEPPTDGTYTRRVSWAVRLEEGTRFYASCKEAETVA